MTREPIARITAWLTACALLIAVLIVFLSLCWLLFLVVDKMWGL